MVRTYDGEELTAEQRAALGHLEGKEHTIRVSSIKGVPYINGMDGVTGAQYLNTAHGRDGREQSTGRLEQEEKMVFKINKRKVIMAVKNKQKLEAGEEMRVAYSWTKKAWTEILERTAEAGDE